MVDELMQWPHARGMFRAGSCHMATDGDLAELHAFAARVGFGRHLFHNTSVMPHYDLTEAMRKRAVAAGAVEVGWREQAKRRRAVRLTETARPSIVGDVADAGRPRSKPNSITKGSTTMSFSQSPGWPGAPPSPQNPQAGAPAYGPPSGAPPQHQPAYGAPPSQYGPPPGAWNPQGGPPPQYGAPPGAWSPQGAPPGPPPGYGAAPWGAPGGAAAGLGDVFNAKVTGSGNFPRDGIFRVCVKSVTWDNLYTGFTWITEFVVLSSKPQIGAMQLNGKAVDVGTPGATQVEPNLPGEHLSFTQTLSAQRPNAGGAIKAHTCALRGVSVQDMAKDQAAYLQWCEWARGATQPLRGMVFEIVTKRSKNQGRTNAANKGDILVKQEWLNIGDSSEHAALRRAYLDRGDIPPLAFDAQGRPVQDPQAPATPQPPTNPWGAAPGFAPGQGPNQWGAPPSPPPAPQAPTNQWGAPPPAPPQQPAWAPQGSPGPQGPNGGPPPANPFGAPPPPPQNAPSAPQGPPLGANPFGAAPAWGAQGGPQPSPQGPPWGAPPQGR